jgi:hypothetical protein
MELQPVAAEMAVTPPMPKPVVQGVPRAGPVPRVIKPTKAVLEARRRSVTVPVIPELAISAPENKFATPGQYSPAWQGVTAFASVVEDAATL